MLTKTPCLEKCSWFEHKPEVPAKTFTQFLPLHRVIKVKDKMMNSKNLTTMVGETY